MTERIIAFFMAFFAFLGLIDPLPGDVSSYSESENKLLEDHLRFSHGATVSLYADKYSKEPLLTGRTPGLCDLPEGAEASGASFVRASAWVSFSKSGNQRLRISGVPDAQITVSFNELNTKPYTVFTYFKKNVFYKINVSFPLRKNCVPTFISDSAYRCSVDYPSFGGEPSEPLSPLADVHLRDPYIMLDKDGFYYMTGTYDPVDWSNTREIHVYRSSDLTDWADLGALWSYERDATWQKELITDGSSPVWAPELHYLHGNYWICYSLGWGAMVGSVLKSTTGRPEGPYEDVVDGPLFDYIDSTFFEDDDGTVYAIWSDGQYAEMKKDMTGFRSAKRSLLSESGQPVGFEGCFVLKYNGLYYLCSSAYTVHYREDGTSYQTYERQTAWNNTKKYGSICQKNTETEKYRENKQLWI
ncbi:MAG: family 43 glycosylhydrolase [Clostridia bacterium]|nr:family 43 glycosylhydrolase [Clostridia bacterium]